MNAQEKVLDLLAKHKCQMVRTKNHNIYRLPSGENYVVPKSPSEHNSWDNSLQHLKVKLGLSLRGRSAKVGVRSEKVSKKVAQSGVRIYGVSSAPPAFPFGEKIRAAIKGEKLTAPQPAPIVKPEKRQEYKPPRRITERMPRHGVVRVWTKEEIEAANIAMRVGKLSEFMQRHHQASQPGAITTQGEQEKTMLAVEQIDATIAELDAGMEAAISEQRTETANIHRLEHEIEQTKLRMQAASDKHNSLSDVKTSLAVIRGDIERVRPMLGLLHAQPHHQAENGNGTRRTRSSPLTGLRGAIAQVLDATDRPLRPAEIHKRIVTIAGCESAKVHSLYTFFNTESKKNGSAISKRVGDNQYWRNGRELPEVFEHGRRQAV